MTTPDIVGVVGKRVPPRDTSTMEDAMYQYALLDPRNTPEAHAHNDQVLGDGSTVLGIEVTIPALAARCGLGNIDPQHLGGDAGTAAIEAAFDCPLPPDGTTLVTVRADADALGAMAVLARRRLDPTWYDDGDFLYRVALIARDDKEATGPWPGPRPVGSPAETSAVAAVAVDHTRPVAERVEVVADWLSAGMFEGDDRLVAGLLAAAKNALAGLDIRVVDGVAVVVGNHRLAMALGYQYAPVVVATNPEFSWQGGEPHRKHTVARWNSQQPMDWEGLRAELNGREPGWGGSTSIMGSPQGAGSTLTTEDVVSLVAAHLTAPAVTR